MKAEHCLSAEVVCSGVVAVFSGTVAAIKGGEILKFFCGFCKGEGGYFLYGYDVSKDCLWRSRSSWKSGN
jgi:uncharacterized protein YsxB (DUF464 family)